MSYLLRAQAISEDLIVSRRYLHKNPEIGMYLPKTSRFVAEKLAEIGCTPISIGKSGISSLIGNRNSDNIMLLRADMDALPMKETSGLTFAAQGEYAHTCGHDMHTAMLLGAARLLKEDEKSLNGGVKLMFQGGEETLEGAKDMINNGILDAPKVKAAFSIHVMPMIPLGFVGYGSGTVASSCDIFNIIINGHGGHAARPHNTVDPVSIAVSLYQAINSLIVKEVDPNEMALINIGLLRAGELENVIPETALLGGTLRTYNNSLQTVLRRRLVELTESMAAAFKANASVVFKSSVCALNIDLGVTNIINKGLMTMLGEKAVIFIKDKMSMSEDFAEVASKVPSAYYVLGCGTSKQPERYINHHPKVIFHEGVLPIGAAVYAQAAANWINKGISQETFLQTV